MPIGVVVSVDTTRAEVAVAAVALGATEEGSLNALLVQLGLMDNYRSWLGDPQSTSIFCSAAKRMVSASIRSTAR